MFVKIRLTLGTLHGAFLLPQSAIQRDNDGAYVYVVGIDDKVVEKRVELGDQRGADWVVLSGIDAGAHVMVSGIQKANAGEKVKAVPYHPSASAAPAATAAD
jgi:membrane fusion protein (multidrug efflux system)